MNTLEIFCVRKSAVFKKYNWRIRDQSGHVVAKGGTEYARVTTVCENIVELWPDYTFQWDPESATGIAYHFAPNQIRLNLLNSSDVPV